MKTALFRLPVSVLSGWTSVRRGFRGPRMGKPNLAAPAPKTLDGKPDLSGI